jgi:hypothetical protein
MTLPDISVLEIMFQKKRRLQRSKEVTVPKDGKEQPGIRNLLCHYKAVFRTPENLNHYTQSDFRAAEKKFFKYVLLGHDSPKEESRTVK